MVILLEFFLCREFFFEKRGRGGGKNKLGPKKVQCDLELIDRLRLAIDNFLAIRRTISDIMLVWRLQVNHITS